MSINNTKTGGQNTYQFIDLVDVPAFARLLERFFQATGVPNGVVDTNGELLSMSSGENACSMFHRTQFKTAVRCRDSNLELVRDLSDGGVAGGLCQNGLMDYVTPVVVEDRQLATLFLGPVLHSPPDMDSFRAQATRFGFDETAYLESIANIPVVNKKQVDDLMAVMVEMAQMLAASGLAKLRQAELERDIHIHTERNIQLRDILDFSPVAMGWSENEDRIEYVNRQFTLLFGYTVDDLPNLETWYLRAYPDENYRKTVIGPWRRAVAQAHEINEPPPELEADITCKDGSVRSVIVRVAWVCHRRMVSFTDISERKQLETSLIEHEQEFRTLAENLPDSIARWDVETRYTYINSVCERTLNTTAFKRDW
ncbi:PocR ligand-binding domain-containing protein [Methylocucumis oryzae]|uniref:PocR ligand-binding domain-containing protein n=1 Tax=Methylocucumis oryzae TaxID=1632867 RepID=UPI000695CA7F|nr:PocR ligand-binding domain-containing protein [Methylocucumis oryzae]